MQVKFSQLLKRSADEARTKNRIKRFEEIRKAREIAEEKPHTEQELEELDYLCFYSEPQRRAILASLTAQPPDPLPPIDPASISFYRRLNKPVFQTRISGCLELDPHLTHESLHILSTLQDSCYPNFKGLTAEFQRDLKLYLSSKSHDVRTMAIIAAGNRVIGKEKDILAMVEEDKGALWVLFNHIFSEKISYKTLLPHILDLYPIAFRAFYEFSNVKGHESIGWFFENQAVVDALMKGLKSPDRQLRNTTLRICGNVLGEEREDYVYMFLNAGFLETIFKFLNSSQPIERKDGLWVLANFCSYDPGAVAVMSRPLITEKLLTLLYYEHTPEIRKEIGHVYSYLITLADRQQVFKLTVNQDFLGMMGFYLGVGDLELSIIALTILQQMVELGEQFKDEEERNVVTNMILASPDLINQIRQARNHENFEISEYSNSLLTALGQSDTMEGEC